MHFFLTGRYSHLLSYFVLFAGFTFPLFQIGLNNAPHTEAKDLEVERIASSSIGWNADAGKQPTLSYEVACEIAKAEVSKLQSGGSGKVIVRKATLKPCIALDRDLPVGSEIWFWEFLLVKQPTVGNSIAEHKKQRFEAAVFFDRQVVAVLVD